MGWQSLRSIWPLELAAKLPSSVRIDGFDISPDQFPPPSSRPENLHLHVHDAFTPFAPEYLGAFDVVHARFWLCIVNNPDAPVLLEKLISLLKPGGYLQWFEPLPLSALTVLAEDMLAAPATDRLTNSWHKPKLTSTYEWVEELPEAFKAHGLEVVSDDQIPMLKHYRAVWGHSMLAGLEDTASNVKLLGVEKSEEIRQWIVDLSDEFAQGASLDTTFICVVGKPGVLETW